MEDVYHDTNHLDAWMQGRRTAETAAADAAARAVVNDSRARYAASLWKPLLAGAIGAALVVGAVYVTLPKFVPHTVDVDHVVFHDRDVSVDHVVPRDVVVDHVIPRDVIVDHAVPRDVPAPVPTPNMAALPAPTKPMTEPEFKATPGWNQTNIRGRIMREEGNGYILKQDDNVETPWYPTKIGPDGKYVPDNASKDDVSGLIGSLAECDKLNDAGTYTCTALDKDGMPRHIPRIPLNTLPPVKPS